MRQSLAIAGLLGLPLLAAVEPQDSYDLVPRFEEGMELEIDGSMFFEGEIDEASAWIDGVNILEGSVFLLTSTGIEFELTERVQAVRDGSISKVLTTVDALALEYELDMDVMGTSQSFSLDMADDLSDVIGRTTEITVDEEGNVTVEPVGEVEEDEQEEAVDFLAKTHFEWALPTEPVAIGDSWSLIDKDAIEEIVDSVLEEAADGGVEDELTGLVDLLKEKGTAELIGTLEGVEGDFAEISWGLELSLELDDLQDLLEPLIPPARWKQVPPDAEGSLTYSIIGEGSGSFDLALKQLIDVRFAADLRTEFEYSFSIHGTDIEGAFSMAGTVEASGGIVVL